MPLTIASPTPEALPEWGGTNLAPLAPLETRAKKGEPERHKLCDFLEQTFERSVQRDLEARNDIIGIGQMIANLATGKLKMLRHPITNARVFVKRDKRFADKRTVGGLFQFYRTKLDAAWISSKPDLDPVCLSDDDRAEEMISAVKLVHDHYAQKLYTDRYETIESHSAQEYGTYITRYRWCPDKNDIVAEILPFPACVWDIRFTPEESPYFIYQQKCPAAVVSKMAGNIEIPRENDADNSFDGGWETNYGLRVIEEIAKQGGGVAGFGRDRTYSGELRAEGEIVVTEMWLRPEAYCGIILDGGEETVGGNKLPAGPLEKIFPEGLLAVGIDGMKTIIGLYAEKCEDHIVSGVYHLQSFSGVGKGVSDAVDVKMEMDDLHSQAMAYVKARGTPAYAYNADLISETDARNIGKPTANIPISFANAPDGVTNINQAIQPIAPQNPAAGLFEYGQQLNNYLQMAFQVTSFSDGFPGVDNKTATGARIGDATAREMMVPQHRFKADARARAGKVIVNLFRKYADQPRFFAMNAKNGVSKGRWFNGAFFDDIDIEFRVVQNSEIPKTPYAQEESMGRLFQFTGGLPGLQQAVMQNPEMAGKVAEVFGVDLPIARHSDIARVCRRRVDQAKKLLEAAAMLKQAVEAMTGMPMDAEGMAMRVVDQLQPPITEREPYHQEKMVWLSELMDADEMLDAPNELREVLEAMQQRHLQMMALTQIENQQATSIANLMGMMPEAMAQQMMAEQAMQGQPDPAQQAQEQAMQGEEQAVRDHERALEMKAADQIGAERLEAMRQQNRPRQAAA